MLARTHALSGAAVWLAWGPAVLGVKGRGELVAGALVTAGAALLPDLDTPTSTLAGALGRPTHLLARLLARVSGGHRAGTHSLLAVVGSWAGVEALLGTSWGRFVAAVVSLLCLALATHVLGGISLRGSRAFDARPVIPAAVLVVVGALTLPSTRFVAPAVGLGVAVHVLGDLLSDRGVPLLWPWPRRQAVPVLTTGGGAERLVAGALLLTVGWLVLDRLLPAAG